MSRVRPGGRCWRSSGLSLGCGTGHGVTSWEHTPAGDELPGPFWRPGVLSPSSYDRANGVLPPTRSTRTWVARKPTPRLQSSRKVRMTNGFPGTSPDPAGLWPRANGLQSGIWASVGDLGFIRALFFRAFWREFGRKFRGNREIPGDFVRRDKPNSRFVLESLYPRRIPPTEDRKGVRLGPGG